jgi:hypothetical protein
MKTPSPCVKINLTLIKGLEDSGVMFIEKRAFCATGITSLDGWPPKIYDIGYMAFGNCCNPIPHSAESTKKPSQAPRWKD